MEDHTPTSNNIIRDSDTTNGIIEEIKIDQKPTIAKSFISAVAFVTLYYAFVYLVCGLPVFEENDDVGMAMVSAGIGFVDKPNEHLFYTHYLIGKALNFLYSAQGMLPWYGLYLLLMQVISMTAITTLLLVDSTQKKFELAIILTATFLCFLRPTELAQFTTTAALLGTAAGLLILAGLEKEKIRDGIKYYFLPAIALTILAAAVRDRASHLILLLTGLAVICRYVAHTRDWKKLGTGLGALGAALLVGAGVSLSNDIYYERDNWREFYPLNRHSTPLREYGRFTEKTELTKSAFHEVGWSPSDVLLFRHWYMLDEEKFSLSKFKSLWALIPPFSSSVDWRAVVNKFSNGLTEWSVLPLLIVATLFSLVSDPRRMKLRSFILFVLCVGIVLTNLTLLLKLNPRVIASVLTFTALVSVWNSTSYLSTRSKLVKWIILSALLIVSGFSVVQFRTVLSESSARKESLRQSLKELNPSTLNLYVNWATGLPLELLGPYDNLYEYLGKMKLVWIGAYGRAPIVMDRIKEFGIENLLKQLNDRRLYLISSDYFNHTLQMHLIQEFGVRPSFKPIILDKRAPLRVYKVEFENIQNCSDVDLSTRCPDFKPTDEILFPSDLSWTFNGMIRDSKVRKDPLNFVSTSLHPDLHLDDLAIDPSEFRHLGIELAAEEWMTDVRQAQILMQTNKSKEIRFMILNLLPDAGMHRYVLALPNDFKTDERIQKLQILPITYRKDVGVQFGVGRIGFIRTQRTTPDQSPLSKFGNGGQ